MGTSNAGLFCKAGGFDLNNSYNCALGELMSTNTVPLQLYNISDKDKHTKKHATYL